MSMQENNAQFQFKRLLNSIKEHLKPLGFSKKGNSFIRSSGENFGLIKIQKDKYNTAGCISFTINYGGGSKYIWDRVDARIYKENYKVGVSVYGGQLFRVGRDRPEDLWWSFCGKGECIELIEKEVVHLIDQEILPIVNMFSADELLYKDIQSGGVFAYFSPASYIDEFAKRFGSKLIVSYNDKRKLV